VLVFNDGSMKNNYASFPYICSHCFGECYLKLQTKMSRWAYTTSFMFCWQ
jgi:hypothetical protein